MRTIETNRGIYKIVGDDASLYAISTGDDNDYYEFDSNASDAEMRERINATCDDLPVGEWISDMERIPRGIPLVLYSGEIYEPGIGTVSEDDDEIISSNSEYDHCPLNHIDQFLIIPDFEP